MMILKKLQQSYLYKLLYSRTNCIEANIEEEIDMNKQFYI